MAEIRKTSAPSDRGKTKFICLYLTWDAALNARKRPHANDSTYTPKQRTELGDTLLRLGLAHCTATAPVDWQIGRSAAGGPIVRPNQAPKHDLQLSLSHSGDYLVAGICNAATIGIDIERIRKRRFSEIAQHLDWPRVTWTPPESLQTDGFYHLWTLWEAAIKSCSTDSATVPETIFNLIVSELTVGVPAATPTHDWFAGSWRCPNTFWLSVITGSPEISDIRLFLVNGLKSAQLTPQISEITSDDGLLDPEIFRQKQAKLT